MSGAPLNMELLRSLLPEEHAAGIGSIRLEMTPHRAFRFLLLHRDGSPAAVAELDGSAERCLPFQSETLSAPLRELLPEPVFRGELRGRPLCIRPYFAGSPLDDASGLSPAERLRIAEELLATVQGERRSHRRFDEDEFERFVGEPVRSIRGCARFGEEFVPRLEALTGAARALLGADIDYSLHHGDFQFSNLLRDRDGRSQIIDWELSAGEGPVWMDRVHLALSHVASTRGCSYGAAARALQGEGALLMDAGSSPHSFASEALSLDGAARRGTFVLCVLHGMSHFLRRVPHLSGPERIEDFLSAGEAFLRL